MRYLNTKSARRAADLFPGLSQELPAGRRTADLTVFAQLLSAKLDELDPECRAVQINSPAKGGDIEIVAESPNWPNLKAITYRADGSWTGLSYWCPDQI